MCLWLTEQLEVSTYGWLSVKSFESFKTQRLGLQIYALTVNDENANSDGNYSVR